MTAKRFEVARHLSWLTLLIPLATLTASSAEVQTLHREAPTPPGEVLTLHPGETIHAGLPSGLGVDSEITFELRRESSGPLTIEARSHEFDTQLKIWVAGLDAPDPAFEDKDRGAGSNSRVVMEAEAGTSYRIVVGAQHLPYCGVDFEISVKAAGDQPPSAQAQEEEATVYWETVQKLADDSDNPACMVRALIGRAGILSDFSRDIAWNMDREATVELARQAIALAEEELGEDHPYLSVAIRHLAEFFRLTGSSAEAKPLLERAIAIREKRFGPHHTSVAAFLHSLSAVHLEMGEYAEARAQSERVMAINEEHYGADHPLVARSLDRLATCDYSMGFMGSARVLLERALAIREARLGPHHDMTSNSLNNLAILLTHMGFYAEAKTHIERVMAIALPLYGPDHIETTYPYHNLAAILMQMGDYARAQELWERTLVICERDLGIDHPENAKVLNLLAEVHRKLGDDAAARTFAERALAIREKRLGPDHLEVARSLETLAELYMAAGSLDEALTLSERAVAINEKRIGPNHPRVATGLRHLARVLQRRGDHARAKEVYERALLIGEQQAGPEEPEVARILVGLGTLLADMGDGAAALERALQAERIGREHSRLLVSALPERLALRYTSVRATGLDLALSLVAGELRRDPEAVRKAWDALIRSRAMVLDEMAARHRVVGLVGDEEVARLHQILTTSRRRLANLIIRGSRPNPGAAYRRYLEEARRQKEQAEEALATKSVLLRQERAIERIGFGEIARRIPSDSVLVAFALYERYRSADGKGKSSQSNQGVGASADRNVVRRPESNFLAFVMPQGGGEPIVVPLGAAAEIERLVARWQEEAGHGLRDDRSPEESEAAYRSSGEALRRVVWDPLAEHIRDDARLFLVPDGALSLVNFAALPIETVHYLIEKGPLIHYLSAERDLIPPAASRPARGGLLVLGNPDFDDTSSFATLRPVEPDIATTTPVTISSLAPPGRRRSACGDFASLRFGALPASAREVRAIGDIWKEAGGQAVRLTGAQATETAFKARSPGRRILHLATHGFFLGRGCPSAREASRGLGGMELIRQGDLPPLVGENPLLLSGIVLAGANHRDAVAADEDDGILTAEEIAALDLSGVEWAVLSACNTGVGELQAGEGVLGLRRAFRLAGARTIIMSLWAVDDEATLEWMRALYRARFLDRLGSSEAVRQASLETLAGRRQQKLDSHPFHWAGFVASGEW